VKLLSGGLRARDGVSLDDRSEIRIMRCHAAMSCRSLAQICTSGQIERSWANTRVAEWSDGFTWFQPSVGMRRFAVRRAVILDTRPWISRVQQRRFLSLVRGSAFPSRFRGRHAPH